LDERNKRSMAVVRPFRPNLAEMAVYRPFLGLMDLSFYFTGPGQPDCLAQLNALGLEGIKAVRYTGYTDFIRSSIWQRFVDFKVGLGSYMLSDRAGLVRHDYVNIVDPIYGFCHQIARSVRPNQKLIMVRWENQYGRYDRIWMASRCARRVFNRTDVIVCVTRASLYSLRLPQDCSAKVVQIYPGIDVRHIETKSDRGRIRNDPPVALFVGRLQWTKGLQVLLVAVSILRQYMRLPIRLKIVGGGDEKPFRNLTETLVLQDSVEFLGVVPNARVRHLMEAADLFCFPSLLSPNWMEQFGFSLVEAMAHALPVVAFDSGAIREICGDDGVYASTGNAFSLAEALAALLRDESTAADRGRRLRLRALQEFDADRQGAKMVGAVL
jgi:glycosyltransferase involved in cell wall biosynthesis